MGKGTAQRPTSVDSIKFRENWDRTFKSEDKNLIKTKIINETPRPNIHLAHDDS